MNRDDEPPTKSASALLVIDAQKGFFDVESPLCVRGANACLSNIEDAVRIARRQHVPVVWIVRELDPTGCDVERYRRHLYVDGNGPCTRGTESAELVGSLTIKKHDHKIVKTRFSGFHHTHLEHLLKDGLGVEHVVLAGVQTPNCIRATAMDALAMDCKQVTILEDATASASDAVQHANLDDLRNMGCVTKTVLGWFPGTK